MAVTKYPDQVTVCLSQVSVAVTKHRDQKQLEGKEFLSSCSSQVTERSQVSPITEGTWRQEPKQKP